MVAICNVVNNRKRKNMDECVALATEEGDVARFQSAVRGVSYCGASADGRRGESWRFEWRENGERKSKSFSTAVFGFDGAKKMAEDFRKEQKSDESASTNSQKRSSGVTGVVWIAHTKSWMASYHLEKKQVQRAFSLKMFLAHDDPDLAAMLAAVEWRTLAESGKLPESGRRMRQRTA